MSASDDWLDSKRLIGPSLFSRHPGALLEVAGEGAEFDARLQRWREHVIAIIADFYWPAIDPVVRPHPGGAMLVIAAPEDQLFTATEICEAAWVASFEAEGRIEERERNRLAELGSDEADPKGLTLLQDARRRGIPGFIDDDGVQVGFGRFGVGFEPGKAPQDIDWDPLGGVPIALLTGTNGKTTTSRMLAAMARAAGEVPALTSTDGALVGDRVLDPGDYAGPGGARLVLRESAVTLGVLETARGGLLRRGLAVDHADVAVVTNIGEDHLGDGGVNTLDDLADVKFLVMTVLGERGIAVLNRDDPYCRARGEQLTCRKAWFSMKPPPNGEANSEWAAQWAWLENDQLWLARRGEAPQALIGIDQMPISLGGAALHNVTNALTAVSAAAALGIPVEAMRTTLGTFGRDPEDNSGRATLMDVNGIKVLLDFGHNPDGMHAVMGTASRLGAKRIHVVLGQAGDRSDEAIRDLARAAVEAGATRFVLKEMAEYRRGREPGEVTGLIRQQLDELGVPDADIAMAEEELEASQLAIDNAAPGDLVLLFVHADKEPVIAALRERSGNS
ncbi:MAG: Mur ligase family protein [Pseudomonadota bacterium]